jgi:hypothetical protein
MENHSSYFQQLDDELNYFVHPTPEEQEKQDWLAEMEKLQMEMDWMSKKILAIQQNHITYAEKNITEYSDKLIATSNVSFLNNISTYDPKNEEIVIDYLLVGLEMISLVNRLVTRDNYRIREYKMKAKCYSMWVIVKFEVEEESLKIIDFIPQLPLISDDISHFISSARANKALNLFLTSLLKYSEIREQRSSVFSVLKSKFPSNITLMDGYYGSSLLIHSNNSEVQVLFDWKITILDDGEIDQYLECNHKASTLYRDLDHNKVMANFSSKFSTLYATVGIQNALIITTLATQASLLES